MWDVEFLNISGDQRLLGLCRGGVLKPGKYVAAHVLSWGESCLRHVET